MPNHVTTQMRTSAKVAASLVRAPTEAEVAAHEADQNERDASYLKRTGQPWPYPREGLSKQFVDFEMLVPSPPNKEVGACTRQHAPDEVCWYSWNIDNWGTKWAAYDSEISEPDDDGMMIVQFDTAWSHPLPVVEALSRKFPDESIDVMYADEDLGQNLGMYTIQNGEITYEAPVREGSPEALELACQIKHGMSYAEWKAQWDEDEDIDDPESYEYGDASGPEGMTEGPKLVLVSSATYDDDDLTLDPNVNEHGVDLTPGSTPTQKE